MRRFAVMAMDVAGPVSTGIKQKIEASLKPTAIKIINDSSKHSGHYQRDGSAASEAGETHFRLSVVSDAFQGLGMVKRHQLIYGLLKDEFAAGLHALSMDLKTPAEAEQK